MSRAGPRSLLRQIALLLLTVLAPGLSRADTVASLLGDFTINQYCKLDVAADATRVHYAVVYGQLPALRELHLADADGNGVTTQAERDSHVARLAMEFASQLLLTVDGTIVPLHARRWTSSLPAEQGGFSLRVDIDYDGAAIAIVDGRTRSISFENKNFQGRVGWSEIVVGVESPLIGFNTNAFTNSLTGGLTEALQRLPENGPLAERAVTLSVPHSSAAAGSRVLGPRPGASEVLARGQAPERVGAESTWLARQTRALLAMISTPRVAPGVLGLALVAALVLGAFHALSPGHGKTVVGAYLVGSRGTPWHAVFLGLTVTVTHTVGVFALGLLTLFASRFVAPERLVPALSLVSGLLVLGMGLFLLVQRVASARRAPTRAWSGRAAALPAETVFVPLLDASHALPHRHAGVLATGLYAPFARGSGRYGTGELMHSHGGVVHSHLPPGADGSSVTMASLLALGISGGLVPCPSALVLLLAAVAMNKTAYGVLLVVAFSVGLAATLTVVGLAFLYARRSLRSRWGGSRWPVLLPVLSAASITLVGAGLSVVAIKAAFFAP